MPYTIVAKNKTDVPNQQLFSLSNGTFAVDISGIDVIMIFNHYCESNSNFEFTPITLLPTERNEVNELAYAQVQQAIKDLANRIPNDVTIPSLVISAKYPINLRGLLLALADNDTYIQ